MVRITSKDIHFLRHHHWSVKFVYDQRWSKNNIRKYIDYKLKDTDRKTFLIPTNYCKTQHMQIKRKANDIQQNITSGTITCILILIIMVTIISSSLSSAQAQIINNNIRNSTIPIETYSKHILNHMV